MRSCGLAFLLLVLQHFRPHFLPCLRAGFRVCVILECRRRILSGTMVFSLPVLVLLFSGFLSFPGRRIPASLRLGVSRFLV